MKRCSRCCEVKTIEAFGKSKSSSWCLLCKNVAQKTRRLTQGDAMRARERANRIKRGSWRRENLWSKFKITENQYAAMLKAQHGVCEICQMPEVTTRNGKTKALAVDHNKASGKIRGLLCAKCNMALGLLDEDDTIMRAMIDYTDKYLTHKESK